MSFFDQRQHTRHETGESAGFTILETCVAMLIMFIAVLGSMSLFVYAIKNNSGANDRELSMGVAQRELEQLRNVEFADSSLDETATSGVTTNLTRAGRPYRMVTTIRHSNVVNGQPTLKTITVAVAPQNTPIGAVTIRSVRATNKIGPNR